MEKCPRCHRYHNLRSPCGIPPTVSLGIGIGTFRPRRSSEWSGAKKMNKPDKTYLDTNTLQKILEEGQRQHSKVVELLKTLPHEVERYEKLLDQEGKLKHVIDTILRQIAVRKGSR